MRVMIHTVPPWAPSGYGVQAALLARGLRDAGHEITLSVYGGFIREEPWEGMALLSCGGTTKGVGRIAFNYRRAKAEAMITVCDLWPLDAREFDGMRVLSWMPVDCAPLSMLDQLQLEAARKTCETFVPVAMSKHGQTMMAEQGFSSRVIPHMVDSVYRPGDRAAWRGENGIPADAFLVSTVGVNGDYPCRKGFPELLAAFQVFGERHPEAKLYMHTQISPGVEGVDLMQIAKSLGLRGQVGFPDQLMRLSDLHGPEYMAAMMRASDVMAFPSYGEGFCVPAAEALACGTPLIVTNGSAVRERVSADTGWLCATQPAWQKLHNAWWHAPLVADLVRCLEKAHRDARLLRRAAAVAGEAYRPERVIPLWEKALASL